MLRALQEVVSKAGKSIGDGSRQAILDIVEEGSNGRDGRSSKVYCQPHMLSVTDCPGACVKIR